MQKLVCVCVCRAATDALKKRDLFSGLNDVMANMMNQMNQTVQGSPEETVRVSLIMFAPLPCNYAQLSPTQKGGMPLS